jgi:uncharacterized membrane protein YbhN (UPF0104 family)
MKGKALIKLFISIGMLLLVLRFVDFSKLAETFIKIPPTILLLVIVVYTVGQCLSSYKWWLIARAGEIDVPWSVALKSYFIGQFVNCFGFGLVGGDVARGLLLANGKPNKTEAIASVVADRMQGLAILSAIGALSIVCFGMKNVDQSLMILLFGIGSGVVAGWLVGPTILRMLVPETHPLRNKVDRVTKVFPKDPGTILYICSISIVFHLSQISIHYLMGLAVGVQLGWPVLLSTIPFVNIVSSLPISWNGLGVREKAYIFFLYPQILTQEQAVAFGAMWLLSVTICSAIGGIVSFLTRDISLVKEMEEPAQVSN